MSSSGYKPVLKVGSIAWLWSLNVDSFFESSVARMVLSARIFYTAFGTGQFCFGYPLIHKALT
jgi:hypothetical protein